MRQATMRQTLTILVATLLLVLPALALAEAPPETTGGGSPEPIAGLLLALAAAPTYLVYRVTKGR